MTFIQNTMAARMARMKSAVRRPSLGSMLMTMATEKMTPSTPWRREEPLQPDMAWTRAESLERRQVRAPVLT